LINKKYLKKLIKKSLEEDINSGDITSTALFASDFNVTARLIVKEDAILCGLDVFKEVFLQLSENCIFNFYFKDGDFLTNNTVVGTLTCPVKTMLAGERTGLNFLQHLSGVATLTHKFVKTAGKLDVYDTRKTLPLLRELEKYAVRIGGGKNHRFGLYDMVLIKDNHIYAAIQNEGFSNRIEAISEVVLKAKTKVKDKYLIEVEVENFCEAKNAFEAGANIIMFDNSKVSELESFVEFLGDNRRRIIIEWSGNVTLETIDGLKNLPIDRVSIGALTHSSKACDFSLKLEG